MNLIDSNQALSVRGNHDDKLLRALKGNKVKINEDLEHTLKEIKKEGTVFKERVKYFLEKLPYWMILDDNKLFVVHAGMKKTLQGINSKKQKPSLYMVTQQASTIKTDFQLEETGQKNITEADALYMDIRWLKNQNG